MKPKGFQQLSGATSPGLRLSVQMGRINGVILPIGSVEQHGAHLPLSTDTLIADRVARRVSERCKATLLMPPLEFGCASEHSHFPGTISLRPETMSNILLDIANSLIKSDLKRVFIINGHGGNRAIIEVALITIKQALPEMQAYSFTIMDIVKPKYNEIRKAERRLVGHADEIETSMMLAITPELVDMPKAVRETPSLAESLSFEPEDSVGIAFAWNAKEISKSGVIGDPLQASAETGKILIDYATEVISGKINGL